MDALREATVQHFGVLYRAAQSVGDRTSMLKAEAYLRRLHAHAFFADLFRDFGGAR